MSLFKKKPTLSEMEDNLEYLDMEGKVSGKEAEVAERRAIVKKLEQEYGRDWKKTLGIKREDLATLRSFLGSAKKGLQKSYLNTPKPSGTTHLSSPGSSGRPTLSPLPTSGTPKA